MNPAGKKLVKDIIDRTKNLDSIDSGELHVEAERRMGYDPIKEIRINKLEKMCEVISAGKTVNGDRYYPCSISERDKELFFEIIKDIKPLMFKMVGDLTNSMVDTDKIGELPINVPFQTFSLEPANDWHSLYTIRDKNEMDNMQMIVVHEETPTRLVTFALHNVLKNDGSYKEYVRKSVLVFTDDDNPSDTNSVYSPISTYLSRLDNRTARFDYRARIKCKLGGNKKIIKIKAKAIYIDPSRKYTDTVFAGRNIEWTHSWEVRGHWRSVGADNIGKDRNDKKVVKGWTWVRPHKKGQGELLTKDRVIK